MKVAVLMGSANDADKMRGAVDILGEFGVEVTEHVMSAHRTPEVVADFARRARDDGYAALICGAGMAAHLAGAVAAQTTLPVIGVPLSGSALNGVDALYSTVMMPRGMPVATVAIDNSTNAGLLAAEIIAVTDEKVAGALADYRKRWSSR
jgi:5-(carboxyamino)imidazole ribonucleotide mutase